MEARFYKLKIKEEKLIGWPMRLNKFYSIQYDFQKEE